MEIPIRPARPSDYSYVIKTWVRSLRNQFPFSKMGPEAIRKYSKRVGALLDSTVVIIACDPQDDDVIFGFACGECGKYLGVESPTLHYVCVRKDLRRHGIGTSLVRTLFAGEIPIIYTHITKEIQRGGLERKWNLGEFDPYYIEGALYSKARRLDQGAALQGALLSAGNPTP